jgi:cytochrome c556
MISHMILERARNLTMIDSVAKEVFQMFNRKPLTRERFSNVALRVGLILVGTLAHLPAFTSGQEQTSKPVPRVQRPTFSKSDWDGIYFENLFEEGLVGERPQTLSPNTAAPAASVVPQSMPASDAITGAVWNQLISSTTIEDEVKSIQKQLVTEITTPIRFKSDYPKAHRHFSALSMLFAIISQYESAVRWKEDAARAQVAFWRAASNARVGTTQAYESCKSRTELLNELVRGGKFVGEEKAPDDLDWSSVVDRNPLMHRLQESIDRLKASTSSKSEFSKHAAETIHEAELLAAIALVLAQENMTDADDEGYRVYAHSLQKFAQAAAQSAKSNDFDSVSAAINNAAQACDACHGEWR